MHAKGRKSVVKMLIALAVRFALCWLPYHVVILYLNFNIGDKQYIRVLFYNIFLGNIALNLGLHFHNNVHQ